MCWPTPFERVPSSAYIVLSRTGLRTTVSACAVCATRTSSARAVRIATTTSMVRAARASKLFLTLIGVRSQKDQREDQTARNLSRHRRPAENFGMNLLDARRRAPRISVSGFCGVAVDNDLHHASLTNLSTMGLRVEGPYRPGDGA